MFTCYFLQNLKKKTLQNAKVRLANAYLIHLQSCTKIWYNYYLICCGMLIKFTYIYMVRRTCMRNEYLYTCITQLVCNAYE